MRKHPTSGVALLTSLLILLLVSSLAAGFILLLMSDQQLSGIDKDRTQTFYAAEAGMEKLTADLGTLFNANYAPSGAQISALASGPSPNGPPQIPGVQYVAPGGGSGYQIAFPPDPNGNPLATVRTINAGAFQGLTGMITPYTLTVTARGPNGAEVKLQRTTQTAGIPVFQFGIFSETDLSFFAGPDFNFGGRVHTNGNLFLAEGSSRTLTMRDKVTAYGDVIRTNLSNGWLTSSNYTGTVNITTSPGSFRPMAFSEGSLTGTLGSPPNPNWTTISLTTYNGYIQNGAFGAPRGTGVSALTLPFTSLGAQPIDLIRRPVSGEIAGILGQRYYAQASLRILLSDNAADITTLPCLDNSVAPAALSEMASPFQPWYTAGVPLATSGASGGTYSSGDGYWLPNGQPTISGFIKIEIQTLYGIPCGTWRDVTHEVLNLGIAGRNIYPLTGPAPPALPLLPGAQVAPSTCSDASPNAVIRLQRVRDNPSNGGSVGGGCGVDLTTSPATVPPNGSDYWPNTLFDTREGALRDSPPPAPYGSNPSLGGVMHYAELDVTNLARYFTGVIGTSGTQARDPSNSTNNFVVYFSDRRSNHNGSASSPGTETGKYGFGDFVNPASQYGCPNGMMDAGEDLDGVGGFPQTYGQNPIWPASLMAGVNPGAVVPNPSCTVLSPSPVWPGSFYASPRDARENPPLFFRRALKIRNGSNINLGTCPNGVACGLTIVSENPVYIEGNYNAAGSFTGAHVAAGVIADAVTFLSNNWNDVNSFASPYNHGRRAAATSWYRAGIVSGKGKYFPQPIGYANPQDFGTDGGVHNFLRYIENWGGQTLNYRGSIVSLYYNRQAIGLYKCCNTVYSPPTRGYNFDIEFLQPTLLPPRTPMFRDINTTGFTQLLRAFQ